ncbi:hypothetical protein [Falsihalocynthiibacter arcticus]|uniref:hypothetical protein n=1 Tax=Falsihalocynthiibacter arcticus TaxID=1579316 RepID=UPI0012E972FF|nr:hypothetical protein [Falsihalocynthiibacter arcticus]
MPIYDQIIELNPPLAFYLTAPPVWISRLIDVSAITTYKACIFAAIMISLVMTRALLCSSPSVSAVHRRIFLAVSALSLTLLPLRDFGQRDHIFAILFLPFLAMQLSQVEFSKVTRATIAVWATLGTALKHYFILIPLLVLIYKIVTERSLRPILRVEFLLPIVLLFGYVVVSYLLHPAYFERIMPWTLEVYGTYEKNFMAVLKPVIPIIWILVAATSLVAITPQKNSGAVLALIAAFGAFVVYLIQSKGWTYHSIPASVYAMLAITWAGCELSRARAQQWPLSFAALALAVLLVPALKFGPYKNSVYKEFSTYFDCEPGHRSFQVFSSNVWSGFPLANFAQAEPANRAPALWLFPGAAFYLSQTSQPDEQQKYRETLKDARALVLDDFFRTHPQIVIVDTSSNKSHFSGASFDYLEFFQQDEAFSLAWAEYYISGKVLHFEVYKRAGCDG